MLRMSHFQNRRPNGFGVVKVIIALMLVCVVAVVALTVVLLTNKPIATAPPGATPPGTTVRPDPANATRAEALAALNVPEFTLVDQDGTLQNQSIFDGKHTVLMLVFTNCPFACPQIMDAAMRVQKATEDSPLQFVAMSVDPTHDTPAILKNYRDGYGADPDRWTMLTGPEGAVAGIAEAGLQLFVTDDTNEANTITLADGSTMSNILHPTRLILVGPDRRVIEVYSTADNAELQRLITFANQLQG